MSRNNFINLEKIKRFITKRRFSIIASIDKEDFPNVKAMLRPRKIEGIKTFYFTTNTSSIRTQQYRENPKACIYFVRMGLIKYQGVMLRGTMEVVETDEVKREIWRFGDKMFYPKGVTDPDYCVLKFTATFGRYYCDLKTESFEIE
jgi:general stress protein 26